MKANLTTKQPRLSALNALCLAAPFLYIGVTAFAQEGSSAPRALGRPLSEVLLGIRQSSSVVVLADSTVRDERVPPVSDSSPSRVEEQVKTLTRALPKGAIWVKLYLPEPLGGRWNADNVADYARAQARLVEKRIGGDSPEGTVEIMGQEVPVDKARDYITGLHLHRVYLLTNPNILPGAAGRPTLTRAQIQQFGGMDSASRFQMLMELHRQIQPQLDALQSLFSQMSDDEKVQWKMQYSQMQGGGGKGKP